MNKIIPLLGIVLMGALSIQSYRLSEKNNQLEKYKILYSEKSALCVEYEKQVTVLSRAITERENKINTIAHEYTLSQKKLKEALTYDINTQTWADTPLPSSVMGVLP